MKSNRTRILLLLSVALLGFMTMMAKRDLAPLTFRPNAAPKQLNDVRYDSLTIDKIPYTDFLRMVAKYRDERQKVINNYYNTTTGSQYGENFQDARYYYISLQALENYIDYIKHQVKSNQLNVDFSGIRIYPIVYPNTGSSSYFSSIPSIYRNHQSLTLTPTYMDESGYAVDFDPDLYSPSPNGSGNMPKSLEMQDTQTLATFLMATFGADRGGAYSAQDHIWLCPPPTPCIKAAALINADKFCPDSGTCPY